MKIKHFIVLVSGLFAGILSSNAAPCNATPNPASWTDSVSVGGKCYCASTNFDHDIGEVKPAGYNGLTVREICERIGPAPAGNHPRYNDIQCGNGPANTSPDEQPECCPGRVDQGRAGCQTIGPKWDRNAVFGSGNNNNNAPTTGSVISIKGNNGKLTSSENGNKPMNCNRNSVGGWEKFTIVDAGGGKVALRGNNGKYVSSENGSKPITCNRNAIRAWEKFTMTVTGTNQIAFKGSNGKYISSENGSKSMTCNRNAIGGWEKFTWQNQ